MRKGKGKVEEEREIWTCHCQMGGSVGARNPRGESRNRVPAVR